MKKTMSTVYRRLSLLCILTFLLSGCGSEEKNGKEKPESRDQLTEEAVFVEEVSETVPQEDNQKVLKAFAVVNPTQGNEVVGAVTFTQKNGKVKIMADIGGLTPGKHGFHIHEHGDCSAHDGSSAGGHFNPTNQPHGGPHSEKRHAGDLGNLEANEFGFAHYELIDDMISLSGKHSIIGKSVVIHAGEDDLVSQPSGNSGSRVACGTIVAAEE